MTKLLPLLSLLTIIGCASKPKPVTRTVNFALGGDGFSSLALNIIEIKTGKKVEHVMNAVLAYEAPGKLPIKVLAQKPLLIAVDQKMIKLDPIQGKYKYKTAQVSSGKRVMHIQSNDYQTKTKHLEQMVDAKNTVVRILAQPHKDGGFDGVMRSEHKIKLDEFLDQ